MEASFHGTLDIRLRNNDIQHLKSTKTAEDMALTCELKYLKQSQNHSNQLELFPKLHTLYLQVKPHVNKECLEEPGIHVTVVPYESGIYNCDEIRVQLSAKKLTELIDDASKDRSGFLVSRSAVCDRVHIFYYKE